MSPVAASSPTMPSDPVSVLSAGTNGRDVIAAGNGPGSATPYANARRIDHLTGRTTPLPDLLGASADSSTIVTYDFQWTDLDSGRNVAIPEAVPRDYSAIVLSGDGGTVAARQPTGQRSWIIDVDRGAGGSATATLLPVTGVVQAISVGGRFVLIGTECGVDQAPDSPPSNCTNAVRWDRQLRTRTTLGGTGRLVGLGIGPDGDVLVRTFGSTPEAVVVNTAGRPEVALPDAPFGLPIIAPDGQTVLFMQTSSAFTTWSVYDRLSGRSQAIAYRSSFPQPGTHNAFNGMLSTDGSIFVSLDVVSDADRINHYSLLWTPVAVRPSTARLDADEVLSLRVGGVGDVGADASSAMLSVTVTDPAADGFATVWPCGQPQPLASNLNFVAGQTRANAVLTQVGSDGNVCFASNVAINLVVDVQGWFGASSTYHPLTPTRVIDTRSGLGGASGRVDSAEGLRIPLAGTSGVAADASAVMLNITATNAVANGFVTVWPCDAARPTASNLNVTSGGTAANAVLTGLGASGQVCVSSNVATDIVIDVQGWFGAGSDYRAAGPVRLADTRNGELDTVGNQTAEQQLMVAVTGSNGVEATATAAMVNLTITNPELPGYATIWPCDQPRPLASNVNFGAGETVAAGVLAELSSAGTICVAANTRSDIVVDLDGWLPSASAYHALTPTRVLDTRL